MKEIVKGITNSALSSIGLAANEIEEEAKRRKDLCLTCKQRVEHFLKGMICNSCGCVQEWHIRSDKPCEKGYWEQGKVDEVDKINK